VSPVVFGAGGLFRMLNTKTEIEINDTIKKTVATVRMLVNSNTSETDNSGNIPEAAAVITMISNSRLC
jgi:hypothetical protein